MVTQGKIIKTFKSPVGWTLFIDTVVLSTCELVMKQLKYREEDLCTLGSQFMLLFKYLTLLNFLWQLCGTLTSSERTSYWGSIYCNIHSFIRRHLHH